MSAFVDFNGDLTRCSPDHFWNHLCVYLMSVICASTTAIHALGSERLRFCTILCCSLGASVPRFFVSQRDRDYWGAYPFTQKDPKSPLEPYSGCVAMCHRSRQTFLKPTRLPRAYPTTPQISPLALRSPSAWANSSSSPAQAPSNGIIGKHCVCWENAFSHPIT